MDKLHEILKVLQVLQVLRYWHLVDLGIINNRMTLKRWIDRGHFPGPIRLGPNSIAWRASDVKEWLDNRSSRTPVEVA